MIDNDTLFTISNEDEFEKKAIDVFNFQRQNCKIYRDYLSILNFPQPTCIAEIPFLPISFFRSNQIISEKKEY